MKLRTSFFDRTVLLKDITRFAPLWGLYLIGGLLIALTVAASSGGHYYYLAQNLNTLIGPFSVISLCYAAIAAQLLFGDLFNTRLCNALHAMPLRREGWFLTHVTAGLLFSLVPNTIISLSIMPFLGQFWFTSLLWLLGMVLHYLFFFGLAVFCMMLTGNRFASTAVYAIINGFSAIVMWFCSTVYSPLLYGVVIRQAIFAPYCPVWDLCTHDDFFHIEHDPNCPCVEDGFFHQLPVYQDQYYFEGLGESWGYLITLAALGFILGVAALVLYRKRHLESAGDFMAFKPMKPVFTIVYTLCVGAVLQIIGNLFDDPLYIFLIIGLIIGYFTAQMLLNRTLRVFQKKHWLCTVLILVLMFGSLVLCKIDAFGLVRWTPNADDVVSVKIADSKVNEFTTHNTDAELTDKQSIEKTIAIHKLLYAEGPIDSRDYYDGLKNVTLCYTLQDGRQVYRQYRASLGGEAEKAIYQFIFSNPVHVLRASSLEELISRVQDAHVEGVRFTGEQLETLLAALWADGMELTLATEGKWWDKADIEYIGYVQLGYKDGYYRNLDIFSINTHTAQWLKQSFMLNVPVHDLINNVAFFELNGIPLEHGTDDILEFCEFFGKDLQDGLILEDKPNYGIPVTIHFHFGTVVTYTVPESAVSSYNWITEYIKATNPA